jgi:hypothetical protein
MVHLELEPLEAEVEENEADFKMGAAKQNREEFDEPQQRKLEVAKVKNIHKLWLQIYPD